MIDPVLGLGIVYNGAIYNFGELKKELEDRGYSFFTNGDTEVILKAYHAWGRDCVKRFSGMFAFCLWERDSGRVLLARDRLGIKPLYFAHTGTELLFGSEIKAVLAGLPGRPAFNRAILPEFLASRYVSGSETFFEGVRKLLPAHTLSWTAEQGIRQRKYWQPPLADTDDSLSRADCVDIVREGLKDAVRSHLVSRGVETDKITAVGIGETRPVAQNTTPEGRANNRRVEIIVEPDR